MCGILGISVGKSHKLTKNQLHDVLDALFIASERRGKDAAGIAVWDDETKCIRGYRATKRAKKFINDSEYKGLVDKLYVPGKRFLAIGHCRLATNGAASKIENAQPVHNSNIAVSHNGIIVNCDELQSKYAQQKSELDTELLLNYIDSKSSLNDGIQLYRDLYTSINGVANLLTLSSKGVVACTNNGSLYRYYNRDLDVVIWASEKRIINCVINKVSCFKLLDLDIVHLKPTQVEFCDGERLSNYEIEYVKSLNDDFKYDKNIHLKKFDLSNYTIDLEKIKKLKKCKKCLLPETMPFIKFDSKGICNYCKNYTKPDVRGEKTLFAEVDRIKREENGRILNSFSGGRDSSYSLYYLKKELDLDIIAYTYDWGMVTDLARRNQSRICSELGIEFITVSANIAYKRNNIKKNIEAWLKKPSLGLVPLFMAGDKQYFYYANEVARQNGLKTIAVANNRYEQTYFKYGFCGVEPTVLSGKNYIGTEQLPLNNILKMSEYYVGQFLSNPSYINRSLIDTAFATISNYFIPHNYLRFFDYMEWNEDEINQVLQKEFNWETRPGSDSTWRIGDGTAPFYNLIYYSLCGFTENDCLRSNQVRAGLMSREEAEGRLEEENVIPYDDLKWYFDVLGLNINDVVRRIIEFSPFRKELN